MRSSVKINYNEIPIESRSAREYAKEINSNLIEVYKEVAEMHTCWYGKRYNELVLKFNSLVPQLNQFLDLIVGEVPCMYEKIANNFSDVDIKQNVTTEQVRDLTAKMYLTPKQFNLFTENNFNIDGIDEISTRTKNQILQLRDAIDYGIGQEEHRGTKLWLLNGITTMLHNEKKWKTPQDEFNSLIDGDGTKKVQKMYDLLLAA